MFTFKPRLQPIKKDYDIVPNRGVFEIKILETMHLKLIYRDLHTWLVDNEYYDAESGKGGNFETLYYEIKKPNGLMFHHIWWRVLKKPRKHNGKYFRYFIKMNYQTIAVSKVETMIEGKKFKTYKGEIIIKLKAYVQVDPNNEWNKHPIIKHFQKYMIERWLRQDIEFHKKELYSDLVELQRNIKEFMGGRAEVPRRKGWFDNSTGL